PLLPLLRNGPGQPRLRHPRRDDGHPRPRLRPPPDPGSGRGGTLHRPPRRADDVHRDARRSRVRPLRPLLAPHRDHGRPSLPGQVGQRGDPGELLSRGYIVMLGYWGNPAATAEAIDAGRWMHTGDLATMDTDGYVNIVGRAKDMIIRGGENIYPREIEEFLYTHPAIADAQVIGVPDERYGEIVCAWIVLKPGASLDELALQEFCRNKIARFKIPALVRFVDAFPMTVTGKIQKFKMRELEIADRRLVEAPTA